jgi:hypothetical protein
MEDRLERLSEARLWAMSPEQVVAGLDEAHAVLVQAQAVFLRYVRQVDPQRAASKESTSSTAVWMRGHHVIHWSLGGSTRLDNLVLLCGYHHAEIHQAGGWTVVIAADGFPTFTPPPHVDPDQRPRRSRYTRGCEAARSGSLCSPVGARVRPLAPEQLLRCARDRIGT